MNICFISPGDFPIPATRGGSVEIYQDMVSRRLADRGHRINLYARSSPPLYRARNVRYHVVPEKNRKSYILKSIRQIKITNVKIIQIDNRPLWASLVKQQIPGVPMILNLHSLTFLSSRHLPNPRQSLAQADAIVVNSVYLKHAVSNIAPNVKKKIHVIYPGVNTDQFVSRNSVIGQNQRSQIRRKFGIGEKPVVLFSGRFIPRKGVHIILRAMQQLWKSGINYELWIVGGGGLGEAYRKQVISMARGWPVRFIGFVSPLDLPKYYAAADLFVCPSQRSEAFGLVNLEAASAGIPVLASNAWGIRESVQHGKNGFLIDNWANPSAWAIMIQKLLQNQEYSAKLGSQGHSWVTQSRTWGHTAAKFEALYLTLQKNETSAR